MRAGVPRSSAQRMGTICQTRSSSTVVADDLAREAGQDRRPDRAPRPLRRVPAGRGGGAAGALRHDPAPDRPIARTAGGSVTGASDGAGGTKARGEPCAEDGSAARERAADRPPAALPAPEPLSGGELRPTEGTGVRNLVDKVPIPGRIIREPAASGECRLALIGIQGAGC